MFYIAQASSIRNLGAGTTDPSPSAHRALLQPAQATRELRGHALPTPTSGGAMAAISTATNLEELPHTPAEEPNARFPPEIKSETASQTRGSTSTRPSLPTKAGAACTSSSPAMWTARRCCADPAPTPRRLQRQTDGAAAACHRLRLRASAEVHHRLVRGQQKTTSPSNDGPPSDSPAHSQTLQACADNVVSVVTAGQSQMHLWSLLAPLIHGPVLLLLLRDVRVDFG